jgi:hypothetical protein
MVMATMFCLERQLMLVWMLDAPRYPQGNCSESQAAVRDGGKFVLSIRTLSRGCLCSEGVVNLTCTFQQVRLFQGRSLPLRRKATLKRETDQALTVQRMMRTTMVELIEVHLGKTSPRPFLRTLALLFLL